MQNHESRMLTRQQVSQNRLQSCYQSTGACFTMVTAGLKTLIPHSFLGEAALVEVIDFAFSCPLLTIFSIHHNADFPLP